MSKWMRTKVVICAIGMKLFQANSSSLARATDDIHDSVAVDSDNYSDTNGREHRNKSNAPLSIFGRDSECDNREQLTLQWNRMLPKNGFHRRMPTTDTLTSVKLPPASILNLSMSAKEFYEVIDSAIDTSSIYSCEGERIGLRGENPSSRAEADAKNDEDTNDFLEKDIQQEENAFVPEFTIHNCTLRSRNHESGIPLSPSTESVHGERYERRRNSRNNQHEELVTRHHRRVSSSRFLLEEWAQENRVRDLYGAAPPAELPQEIAFSLLENQNECEAKIRINEQQLSTNKNSDSIAWWSSPFASPFVAFHKNTNASQRENGAFGNRKERSNQRRNQCANERHDLKKPLLPELITFRDEEVGAGGETSDLLGECLLLPEGDRKQIGSAKGGSKIVGERGREI
eukprot:CAMPEP_0116154946 /NCGR_PEP_ID=MMETSP0329-20121206/22048_1 /TAXON_ID=697910 /ORGANISM="Pseudo-nitzschia arenysensis, Strain B593" /LENGTH=400 /DNA_ID=CAMNT_0003651953 /DNA_START=829 /DNA_END=2032 /DNA_ORIENTATION=-